MVKALDVLIQRHYLCRAGAAIHEGQFSKVTTRDGEGTTIIRAGRHCGEKVRQHNQPISHRSRRRSLHEEPVDRQSRVA